MPSLTVRKVDCHIVEKLRQQAAANGRSAAAEHRAILADALGVTLRRTFAEALMAIPASDDPHDDTDFARLQ